MISVLIPVLNYDLTVLVNSLISQLATANVDFEIVCIDDDSSKCLLENNKLGEINNVTLLVLSKNIGRSKIRNLLVKKASYNWLLFLDADVIPKNKNFINVYLKNIKSRKANVYCGGISYKNEKPEISKRLRWVYGRKREEINAERREKTPYQYFFSANFLAHKSVFDTCQFNEVLVKYGFEDVLFAEELSSKNIKIKHLNNDVFHLGIENNDVFLGKTKNAIENLHFLYTQNIIKGENLTILIWYRKLETYNLKGLLAKTYTFLKFFFERNLKSKNPSLFIFDLYKLSYFCYL